MGFQRYQLPPTASRKLSHCVRQQSNMRPITRRALLKGMAATTAASILPGVWRSRPSCAVELERQPLLTAGELAAMAAIARQFMKDFGAPGLSIAMARHGSLVYQQGFGYADETGEKVTPAHLFRIASVTKPITAVTIFALIEQGRLKLDDSVFGPQGRLGFDYGKDYPDEVNQITVRHLLTHTGGGWDNTSHDPMVSNPQMDHKALITWTLQNQSLEHPPGTHYAYSNFGYCVLGRLIEKLTGQSYIEYVQQTTLAQCSIKDMRLATNQRAPGEVRYYGQNGEESQVYTMNISRMDSHGGWLATPSDLVRFAIRTDGFATAPDMLKPATIATMTTPSAANPGYACGWCVNKAPNWWHNGSLPGTASIMVRTARGLCWAALTNTRRKGIDLALDQMMWKLAEAVPAWQA